MPCRYDPSPDELAAMRRAREEKRSAAKERAKIRKQELDLATRLLCGVCRTLERASVSFKLASEIIGEPELKEWYERHKAADEKRLKKEAEKRRKRDAKRREKARLRRLKESAVSKLTDEEREALGL